MQLQQENRPHLRRSVSTGGITKHSRRAGRFLSRQQSFNHQTRRPKSFMSSKENYFSKPHPYRAQNYTFNTNLRRSFLRHARALSSQSDDVDELRILDAGHLLREKTRSIIDVSNKLKQSLCIVNNSKKSKEDHSCSQAIKKREGADCELKDISNHEISSFTKRSDKDGGALEGLPIPMPCFNDLFTCDFDFDLRKDTDMFSSTKEERADDQINKQECEDRRSEEGEEENILNDNRDPSLSRRSDAGHPSVATENSENDTKKIVILVIQPCVEEEEEEDDKNNKDKRRAVPEEEHDALESLLRGDFPLRDLVCIESPSEPPTSPTHSLQPSDYRDALVLQQDYTCLYCGSSLEVNPLEDLMIFPSCNGLCHLSDDAHYHGSLPRPYSPSDDCSTLFCPTCCVPRLVQSRSTTY